MRSFTYSRNRRLGPERPVQARFCFVGARRRLPLIGEPDVLDVPCRLADPGRNAGLSAAGRPSTAGADPDADGWHRARRQRGRANDAHARRGDNPCRRGEPREHRRRSAIRQLHSDEPRAGGAASGRVAPRDIQTASVALQPQYRYADNQPPAITGYQATNSVAVRFRDIARSGAILDALVREGANQIDGPNLSLDQPEAALDEARTDAVRRARARADLYARAAGMNVVRIVSIAEAGQNDGSSPRPPIAFAMRARADAPTPIAAGEADVSVSLNVRFLLR